MEKTESINQQVVGPVPVTSTAHPEGQAAKLVNTEAQKVGQDVRPNIPKGTHTGPIPRKGL